MSKPRYLWMALVGCLGVIAAAAQPTDFVTLDNRRVHPTRLLVRLADQAQTPAALQAAERLGLRVHRQFRQIPGLIVLDAADAPRITSIRSADPRRDRDRLANRLDALRASGLFALVQPDYLVHAYLEPDDEAFQDGRLWGLKNTGQDGGTAGADIDAVNAWDITTGSDDVIVAVIDTGIRYTHQDLQSQMWVNPGEIPGNGVDDDKNGFIDDVHGINAITGSGDPFDDNDHGTHVAGTIGAAANNGHPHVGVAWNLRLMACKFLTSEGFGAVSDAITCIDYAVTMGARILNNSWGGGPFDQALLDSIRRARTRGVLFVAAAGNDGLNNDDIPTYPASYDLDNIISVAALDRNDNLADFSNFGANSVDIGAPGVEIFSTIAASDQDYDFMQGTSMATPHVTGVAALLASVFPEATYAELREAILGAAVPIPALEGKASTGGRLNAFGALKRFATPDGVMEVGIDPPSGSILIAPFDQPVFVRVRDGLGVTNATVTARVVSTGQTIAFSNDGQAPDATAGDAVYSGIVQLTTNVTSLELQLTVRAPDKEDFTATLTYTIIPEPPNDNFADAIKIDPAGTPEALTSNNGRATLEEGEPVHGGVPRATASLWWKWSPTRNTPVFIDTTGSSFATVLAVYTGGKLFSLREVASAYDTSQKTRSFVDFNATAGTTYFIAVASPDTNSLGSVRLRVVPSGQPDTTAPTVAISNPASGSVVVTERITISGTAADPQPNATGVRDVQVKVGSAFARTAEGTTNWSISVKLAQGDNRIEVRANDFSANESTPRVITIRYRPLDPINDVFARGILLEGTEGTATADTTLAGKEVGEPLHAGNEGGASVWWFWRAPQDGILTLSTTNSTFDTLLALYTGTRVTALTPVASNDDAFPNVGWSKITQAVQGGVTYRIAVDGFAGERGSVVLNYSFTPGRIVHVQISTVGSGAVTPGSGFYEAASTVVFQATPASGFRFVRWLREGVIERRNPLPLVVGADTVLSAEFEPIPFTDDFETGGFSKQIGWMTDTAHPWFVQTNVVARGQWAARSGAISDGQESRLVLVQRTQAGSASFDFKVSSEFSWDLLQFYLNGRLLGQWSGEVGWQSFSFTVPGGNNRFEWVYVKDANRSAGLDAAFLDNLDLPLRPPINETTAARLSLQRTLAGVFQVRVQGQKDQTYVIEGSSDLKTWEPLTTGMAADGVILYVDPQGTSLPRRFYRATVP